MTKLLQRLEVTLRSFYVFNSSFGEKEGEEHKKVLYYHPNDIELNTKIKDVGLSEAIIRFTGTFTTEDDCKALHTQKTTQLFHQPELGFWLVLVLNVPKEIRLKEGVEVADYRGGEISDRIYRAVLRQCYQMYRFQHGALASLGAGLDNADQRREMLSEKLLQFFDTYLISLKDLAHCDIIDMLHSIQYLPLDRALFLRAHNFGMLCATFPVIKESIMLYNEQIVCGGKMGASDLYSLHAYIVQNVLPMDSNASSANTPVIKRSISECQAKGFVRCHPSDASEGQDEALPLTVYLSVENQVTPHYLLIYRALQITLCLFLDAKQPAPKQELYDELHAYIAPQLTCLARDIASEVSKEALAHPGQDSSSGGGPASNDTTPKYLFINEQSLQHHTNIHRNGIPRNVMSVIADLANPGERSNVAAAAATEELQVKTTNDYWIVKRCCNWRQYYVILCNSKATLLDVTQEAKRIFEQELTDDVFFDK
ncbi:vacuolar fusion protein CCZ1 homolog [Drosophila pseudoobscura]|uniref:Vacuolar fusion protein CCZ1 homolog n=1 Tax=Drosophila pseudoobscura pseudoobscura TaxID=46245 RepID=Q29EZ5_DROPS|nr:vacuolar fusion protein CCZ1 homolog [Drosophila pseudoobscura]